MWRGRSDALLDAPRDLLRGAGLCRVGLRCHGITRTGGLGTWFVDCITGNPLAPIEHAALFADCATSNPAATFFAFRACCGAMSRAVITFSDANTGVDAISFF